MNTPSFTSTKMRRSPDQHTFNLNQMSERLGKMQSTIRIVADDAKTCIIIGTGQPINPATNKPYSFGVRVYDIKGDRLTLRDTIWEI